MATIILTGGGTAGHVIPNISLLPYLKKSFDRIIYLGSDGELERNIIKNYPEIEYYPITTAKLNRSLDLKNLLIPFRLNKGKKEAMQILKDTSPAIIFSKGGFVAVPVILAGKKLNIPILAHESDYSLGLANKITGKHCCAICTTFKDTASTLSNGIYTGPPYNKKDLSAAEKSRIYSQYNLDPKKPLCLIVGGSQGAQNVNRIISEALDTILDTHQILHVTGKGKLNASLKHPRYHTVEYVNNMPSILAITDVAITRGGSNAIHEMLAYQIPMLIIPLSKNSRGDQVENAKYFESKGYCLTLPESELNLKNFEAKFKQLLERKNLIRASNKYAVPSDSLDKIYNLILKYAKLKN